MLRALLSEALAALGGALGDRLVRPERRPARRQERQRRQADRLARTLGDLKGPFVKAGQFAAVRHDLVPAALAEALGGLRDRVPALPLAELRGLLETELGAPLEERFRSFEETALAAASIAQVHRAVLPDGTAVAVKVQYPWLAASLGADLGILRTLLRLGTWWSGRGAADVGRLFDEFGAALAEELDFAREARVAGEIAANLSGDPRIVVPRVVPSHSTRRVLTMSYHPAVRVTDRAALDRLGVDPREVLEILGRAYAKQVFVDGLFHADPHPGNLYVIDEPGAEPRVLFLDFGLSKRLAPELRRELRLGAHALLRSDPEALLGGMERMGMIRGGNHAEVARSVERMFERLRGESGALLALPGDRVLALKDEAKALLRDTPGVQLPNDLLLYAKTLSYLFALGEEIAPDAKLMQISLPYLLKFLASNEDPPAGVSV